MKQRFAVAFGAFCIGYAALASAKVGPDEAGKLGKDLTPVGAEKAANKDGSIPESTPATKHGDQKGEFPHDAKIDADKPKFTITAANMAQYADKLTEGHKWLLKNYDTYKMNVYPTHRDVNYPEEIKAATIKNATTCEMIGTDTLDNCKLGFPFPIPKTGAEPRPHPRQSTVPTTACRCHRCAMDERLFARGRLAVQIRGFKHA